MIFMREKRCRKYVNLNRNRELDTIAALLVLPVLMISLSSPSYGNPIEHLTLEEIVITDYALSETMSTVVGIKTIERGRNINLSDVLKDEPGIDIKRRAGVGDTADILSIRGFSGNRIMLTINDRPVNSSGVAGGYYIDWGTIPLDNIEKIEMIMGGSVARYGNNAFGGVINVITKKPSEKPTITFFGTYGGGNDIDTVQNYRLTHTFKIGPMGYSLAASYQKADPFLWNNDFEGKNLAATIYMDMPLNGLMTLGLQYNDTSRGFIRENRVSTNPDDPDFYVRKDTDYPLAFGETLSPYSGSAFIPGPGAVWDKTTYYLDLGYAQPIGDARVDLKLYQNIEDRKEKNYSANTINPSYADGFLVLDRKVASDRSYGGSLQVTKPTGNHELKAGVDHAALAYGDTGLSFIDETYNSFNYWGPSPTSYSASSEGVFWGVFVEDKWELSDRFILTAGLRWDDYHNKSIHGSTLPELEDNALTPKLTGTYQFADSDTLTIALYQAMRAPGLPETYWWAEGETHGSPVLKPEKNTALDVSFRHDFAATGFLRLSAYHYRVEDYILFRFDPNWRGVYNIDHAIFSGASVDGRAILTPWLSANGYLTWQKTNKEGDIYDTAHLSDEIDYLPEWKAGLGMEFKLPYQCLLAVALRYVGERHTVYAYQTWGWPPQQYFSLMELDSYFTADVSLKIPVNDHLEASIYGENLFDEDYEEQFGYPMPGLIAGATVKILF